MKGGINEGLRIIGNIIKTQKNSGKPWKYILVPPNMVQPSMSFDYFAMVYEQKINESVII